MPTAVICTFVVIILFLLFDIESVPTFNLQLGFFTRQDIWYTFFCIYQNEKEKEFLYTKFFKRHTFPMFYFYFKRARDGNSLLP